MSSSGGFLVAGDCDDSPGRGRGTWRQWRPAACLLTPTLRRTGIPARLLALLPLPPSPGQSQGTVNWGRYHGGLRPSSDDSFHSPTVIPPSALDKPSIMKRYHRRRPCSHTSPRRWPTMVTLHDTRFVECRWWNDGWTVKTVVT